MDVRIETNGCCPLYTEEEIDLFCIDDKLAMLSYTMDIKCPGSAMQKFNNYDNFKYLKKTDEVKFVIKNRDDFDFAIEIIKNYNLNGIVDNILFSPVFGELEPVILAGWILDSKKNIRMQLQIHKFIWHPNKRGV
jgi:7-carboxy-7-deazaguanine synthase